MNFLLVKMWNKKIIIKTIAKTGKNELLVKENVLALNRKLREGCPEMFDKNLVYHLLEFVSFTQEEKMIFLLASFNKGHLEGVKYLVDEGMDVTTRGDDIMIRAIKCGHLDIVKYLVEIGLNLHACEDNAFYFAVRCGHLDIVKYLVTSGFDVHEARDMALVWAADAGHLEIIKYLVDIGLDFHRHADIILTRALEKGYSEIVQFCTERQAAS